MCDIGLDGIYEIRLRIGKPVCISCTDGLYYLNTRKKLSPIPTSAVKVSRDMIDEAMEIATDSSVYSVQEQIKRGYITLEGGHRLGICGTAVVKNGDVSFIKNISSLNYRIAHEIIGVSDEIIPKITDDGVKNTLIISPPGAGKTTMLRDIVRRLSNGDCAVSVVDERGEIAAVYDGVSRFNLGLSTDVMDGIDKTSGAFMMLRSMSPSVIAMDEIGTDEDIKAIERIINSGTSVIATIHADGIDMIKQRAELQGVLKFFDVAVILSKRDGIGTVEEVRSL